MLRVALYLAGWVQVFVRRVYLYHTHTPLHSDSAFTLPPLSIYLANKQTVVTRSLVRCLAPAPPVSKISGARVTPHDSTNVGLPAATSQRSVYCNTCLPSVVRRPFDGPLLRANAIDLLRRLQFVLNIGPTCFPNPATGISFFFAKSNVTS